MDGQTDALRGAMAREEAAFLEIADRVKARLYRTARAILGGEADALEALDETMYKAWRNIHKLRQPDSFDTWITTILINECRRKLRRQRREKLYADLPESASEAFDTLPIQDAVRRLPEKLRDVVCLRFFADLTLAQTAQTLALPEGTVKTLQRKALALLRVELEEESI